MASGMNAPLYTLDILRLAAALPEPRQLERVDGSALQRSPTCGSSITTDVQMRDGRVEAVSQAVSACAFGQASAAVVAQQAPGRTRDEIGAMLDQLTAWLGGTEKEPPISFDVLSPARSRIGRHGAIVLPLRALVAAIENAR
jgi:NifU-like protein involved in Fe-S cluster formation